MSNQTFKMKQPSYSSQKKQRGVVLIMALTILMVLTLIGVSAMKTSSLQERMSGNARDYQIAFEAAEIALRAGEDYIKSISLTTDFSTAGTNGRFKSRAITGTDAWRVETNWTSGKTTEVTVASITNNPEYMIEILDSTYGAGDPLTPGGAGNSNIKIFRITSRGYGKNPNTKVMLQTDFGKYMN